MDRAAQMTAFVRTVETGGFTAAARQLGLTPSALSKLVTRLEDRLGARLVQRTTRRMKVTAEGESFYMRARAILKAMDDAETEVIEAGGRPRGLLRLHCGSAFGIHQLNPVIPRFQAQYPEVELDITVNDQESIALDDRYDLAIRIGRLDESSMVARQICTMQRLICASPRYLALHGVPATPDELQQHNCLWVSSLPALRRWPFDTEQGIKIVPVRGNVVANSAETVMQLAIAGVGITRMADVMVGEAITAGKLVPILQQWNHVEPIPLYATYPSGRNLSPKVRAMVDFLVAEFSSAPWRAQTKQRGRKKKS